MYGNNPKLSAELVKKYHIKYYYEDFYSIQSSQECLNGFEQMKDPRMADLSLACLRIDPGRENYINEAGIPGIKVHTRLDPASSVAPLFDMIAIKPSNTSSWLQQHSTVVKQTNLQNGVLQRLWEITP